MTSDPTASEAALTHHTALVADVRLHYVLAGEGDPVVLLHGWPQTWYEWRRIMPALAGQYTVIAPDMRGAGDSSKPLTGYDKRTLAKDINALVRQLGFQRVHLVGHDIGLMVAYAYAAAYPEEVRRLVVLDCPLPGIGPWEEEILRDPRAWHFYFHGKPDIPEALVAGRERIYLSSFFFGLAYNPAAITEEDIDEYVRCYSAPGALRAGFEYYRAFAEDARQNKEHAKTKLKMPVLALGGDIQAGPFMVDQMRTVAEDVRGGSIEGCGHWIPEERPDHLAKQLLTFFGEA